MKDRFEIRIFNERFNVEYDYCTGNEDVCLSVKVTTKAELYSKWRKLLKDYEGDSYAIWDHKYNRTITWGAYDPNDWQELDDYFKEEYGRIEKVDKLFHQITEILPCIYDSEVDDDFKETHFLTNPDGTEILSTEEVEVETIANLFDQLYEQGTCATGYYDPVEDKRNNEVDAYTGLYYVTIG